MYIIRGISQIVPPLRGGAVTIGNFDGVHLGHQSLFHQLRQLANDLGGLPTLAITFEPHPQKLLNPRQTPERITGVRGKARWIAASAMDAMVILRFTRELAAYQPEQFVRRILVEGLAVRTILVGENFRFGAGGQGSFADLQAFGARYGFDVHSQSLVQNEQQVVSSTRIRELVKTGQMAAAATLLGREFEMEARVTPGHKRGQELGFSTANMALAGMLHPPLGVYIVEAWSNGHWLPAVANMGHNPTFGNNDLRLEVHILAEHNARFSSNLYRQIVRVRFLQYRRNEIKFDNMAALQQQIAADIGQARAFFKI